MLNKPLVACLVGGVAVVALAATQRFSPESTPPSSPPAAAVIVTTASDMPGIVETESSDPLPPPMGLQWGDSPEKLAAWARNAKLEQRVRTAGENQEVSILTISAPSGSLPSHGASAMKAHFIDGQLFEVSLHYRGPDQRVAHIEHKFQELKQLLAKRHGSFAPARHHVESQSDVMKETRSFQLEPAHNRKLIMTFDEALDTRTGESAATFQVTYHNGSLLERGQKRKATKDDSLAMR